MTELERINQQLDREEQIRAKQAAEDVARVKRSMLPDFPPVILEHGVEPPAPMPEPPAHPRSASFLPSGVNTGKTWSGGGESSGPVTPNNLP